MLPGAGPHPAARVVSCSALLPAAREEPESDLTSYSVGPGCALLMPPCVTQVRACWRIVCWVM